MRQNVMGTFLIRGHALTVTGSLMSRLFYFFPTVRSCIITARQSFCARLKKDTARHGMAAVCTLYCSAALEIVTVCITVRIRDKQGRSATLQCTNTFSSVAVRSQVGVRTYVLFGLIDRCRSVHNARTSEQRHYF